MHDAGRRPRFIVANDSWVAKGYVYVTENSGKYYILANSVDVTMAVAKFVMSFPRKDLSEAIYGYPITEHEQDAQIAICGKYLQAYQLK